MTLTVILHFKPNLTLKREALPGGFSPPKKNFFNILTLILTLITRVLTFGQYFSQSANLLARIVYIFKKYKYFVFLYIFFLIFNKFFMPFNFNAKHIFITYPRFECSKEELLSFLSEVLPVERYCICSEEHEEEGKHMHAVISMSQKKHFRDERFLDFRGHHPHIESPRKLKEVIAYCQKDGDFISNYPEKRTYGDLIKDATDVDSFLSLVEEHFPRDAVLSHDRIRTFAEFKYQKTGSTYVPEFPLESFKMPSLVDSWYQTELLGRPRRPKTLVLVGGTRLGKTEFARSISKHIYWNGMIDLATFDSEADYVIFDDFEWDYFPNKKSWWGGQLEFTVTDKYRKKRTIKWGKPMIWLNNEHPPLTNWFLDNAYIVTLNSPLY